MADTKLDLSNDNRVVVLLEDRERIKRRLAKLNREYKQVNDELKEKMGNADTASTNDWDMEIRSYLRREYTVPAQTIKSLIVNRKPADDDE